MAKKAVFIVAQKDFQEVELFDSKKIIEQRGFEAKIAALTAKPAVSKQGTSLTPDLAISEVRPEDFDAIVFIGGPGAADYFEDQTALKLARDFVQAQKIIAAICIAPSILANAGVLISRTATGFPSQEENLKNKGAFYTAMPVEVDGKIVTAKNPDAAKEFGEKIAYLLEE